MFYSNKNFLDTYLGTELSRRYALWYARYADTFDGTDCGMWQYSSQGSVPGISGSVDLDISYVDYPAVIRKASDRIRSRTCSCPVPGIHHLCDPAGGHTERDRSQVRHDSEHALLAE